MKKKNIGTMDKILVLIGVTTAIFIVTMIFLFVKFQSVPDTLIGCYFGLVGSECGIMGWIKNVKEKNKDRIWELADRAAGVVKEHIHEDVCTPESTECVISEPESYFEQGDCETEGNK